MLSTIFRDIENAWGVKINMHIICLHIKLQLQLNCVRLFPCIVIIYVDPHLSHPIMLETTLLTMTRRSVGKDDTVQNSKAY